LRHGCSDWRWWVLQAEADKGPTCV
jgi:hypothetical protein